MSPSRYWELTVGVPADLSEGLTNLVWELGALGVVEEEPPAQAARRMIDLGTGSGILAIAAARLGVDGVLAVDDDPDAVASAMANAARNHVSDRVRCVLADAERLDEAAAPLVVANLLTAAHR